MQRKAVVWLMVYPPILAKCSPSLLSFKPAVEEMSIITAMQWQFEMG